jgi:transposase
MEYYAGIDVSLKESSVCVVDSAGKVVREVKVASEPEALVRYFDELGLPVGRIGLEAGPLSQWLHAGLIAAGRDVVLLETRHVKAVLSAMTVKTDRKDARGIAQLLRMGWYRPVHAKSAPCKDIRALLVGRKLLQGKLLDVELSIRGILRGYGLKVGEVSRGRFEARIRELTAGHAILEAVIGAMLAARMALWNEFTRLHREMLKSARADMVCRRLMTTSGVGALVALTYRSAVDDPSRFGKSAATGAYFGLTPKKYQSGETDRDGGVSKSLKRWALGVAQRRGMKRAKVALARKLGVVLHRMWVDMTDFRWANAVAAA